MGIDPGDTVITGPGLFTNVKVIFALPYGVVTVRLTEPDPAGATAVIDVEELIVKLVAAAVPNWTWVAPLRFVPVMVTVVPPAVGPRLGLTLVMVGAVPWKV